MLMSVLVKCQKKHVVNLTKLHLQNNLTESGMVVGESGDRGKKEGRVITHLWVDCCCSWRRSQRCCWMPWQGSQDSVEPPLQSMCTDLAKGKSRIETQKPRNMRERRERRKESMRGQNSWSSQRVCNQESRVCDYRRNPKPQACRESSRMC